MARGYAVHHPGLPARDEPQREKPDAARAPPAKRLASPAASSGELRFANGNVATRVTVSPDAEPAEVIRMLGVPPPQSLLLLIGGADAMEPALSARLQQLFGRGLVPAAAECGALILDGGTHTGIMALIGQGVADRGHPSPLVGVAPAGRVALMDEGSGGQEGPRAELDPNHSHFVLVRGDTWGSETQMLFRLASTLASNIPVLVVLVNGGEVTKQELLRAVRRRWPITVIQGSGRLADELATALQAHAPPEGDAVLGEILGDGDISLFPIQGPVDGLERLVARQLGEETVLRLAWQRFASYDANASREQSTFRRLQLWILILGVVSTALALLQTQLGRVGWGAPRTLPAYLFQVLLVAMVASMTALIAATSRFKAGSKWILLRGNAESIKREIYRHRCRLSPNPARPQGDFEQGLARQLKTLSRPFTGDEPLLTALRSYKGPLPPPGSKAPGDDGISPLSPVRYIHFRLDDQLGYYRDKIDELDRQLLALQWTVIAMGSLGTVLAAIGLELWVVLATSIVMAITTYLGYQQSEARMTKYQQATTDLENLKAWWRALSLEEQSDYRKFDALVDRTELILQSEVSGWVQDMKEVILRLDARHEREPGGAGTKQGPP